MSWILAAYLATGIYSVEFNTEQECVLEMRKLILTLEAKNKQFSKIICEPGLVDEDEKSVGM